MGSKAQIRLWPWVGIFLVLEATCGFGAICVYSAYRKFDFIYSKTGASIVHLPQGLIIEKSQSVFVDGRLLEPNRDYEFDPINKAILLFKPIADSCLVEIKFVESPFPFKHEYTLRDVEETWKTESLPDMKQTKLVSMQVKSEDSKSQGIKASGMKSIRIETGSISGFRVSQALDLTVSGSAGSTQIRGRLSDKDMVTGSLGSSSRLGDLDRVFVEVTSDRGFVKIGDIEIKEKRGELLTIRRQATGIQTRFGSDSRSLVLSGSAKRNIEKTALLVAREGLSGPYVIPTSEQGYRAIVINSEQVYVDGKLLKRGEANDYTIDYDRGLIFFNPRIILEDGSRIVVTYEVESEAAEEIYYIGSDLSFGSLGKMSATYASRMTSAEASVSEFDTTGHVQWVDGGKHVGQGFGDYIKVSQDSITYYKYVGKGEGDYQVRFTRVGEGKGKYIEIQDANSNQGIYLYTGNGPYADKIPITRSTRQNLLHLATHLGPSESLRLDCEVAKSQSQHLGLTDADRPSYLVSLATKHSIHGPRDAVLGEIGFNVRRLATQPHYFDFREKENAQFLEKWKQTANGERISQEVGCIYRLHDFASISANAGKLESTSGVSKRKDLESSINLFKTNLEFGWGKVTRNSNLGGASFVSDFESLSVPLGAYKLLIGRRGETRKPEDDSLWLRRWECKADLQRASTKLSAAFSFGQVAEKRFLDWQWKPYCKTTSGQVNLSAKVSRRFDLGAVVIYRFNDYQPWTMLGSNHLLTGDLHLNLREMGLLSEAAIDYSLTRRLSSLLESKPVRMDGVGDYDSLGNFVPGAGDYTLTYKEVGKLPVTHATLSSNLVWGEKGKVLPKSTVVARSGLRVETEIDRDGFAEAALIYGAFGKKAIYSSFEFSQDLAYRKSNGSLVRLDGTFSRLWDSRYIDMSQVKRVVEIGAQIRFPASKATTLTFEVRNQTIARSVVSCDPKSSSHQCSNTAKAGVEYNPLSGLQASLATEICKTEMDSPLSKSLTARLGPRLIVQTNGIRITNSMTLRKPLMTTNTISRMLTRQSFELSSRADIRRSQRFWVSIEYNLVKISGMESLQTMRSSFNASF